MPPSIFWGRVMPKPGQPLWTDVDREAALALAEFEATNCPGCGNDRTLSMDPDHESEWDVEAVRCHACAARDRRRDAWGDPDSGSDLRGVSFIVRPAERSQP